MVLLFIFIQTSWFQTWLGGVASKYFSKEWNTEVRIDKVDIDFFDAAAFEGLYIEDLEGDTLVHSPVLYADFAVLSLGMRTIAIDQISLQEPRVNLVTYEGDSTMNFQYIVDYFASEDTTPTENPWTVTIAEVELENAHFSLTDHNVDTTYDGFMAHDMDFKNLDLRLNDYAQEEDTLQIKLSHLALKDKSGFELDSLAGDISISPAGIALRSFHFRTPNSAATMEVALETASYSSFANYFKEVHHYLKFEHAEIDAQDIAYFVPDLKGLERELVIESGRISGYVEQLSVSNLYLIADENTNFKGSAGLTGLPAIEETFITVHVDLAQTNYNELTAIPLPPFDEEHYLEVPDMLRRMGQIKMKGNFDGTLDDFVAQAKIKSRLGLVKGDIHLQQDPTHDLLYSGKVAADNFDLGRLLQRPDLGSVTASFDLDSAWGADPVHMTGYGNGIVEAFHYNGYHYTDMTVEGILEASHFRGKFESFDPNLDLTFDGEVDFRSRRPKMIFDADLRTVNLAKLNLIDRDPSSHLEGEVTMNLRGKSVDDIVGKVNIERLVYSESGESYMIDSAVLTAKKEGIIKSLDFKSSIVDANLTGQYDLEHIGESFQVIASTVMPALFGNQILTSEDNQNFDFDVTLKDVTPVTELFLPELKVAPGTRIFGEYAADNNQFEIEVRCTELVYDGRPFRGICTRVDKEAQNMIIELDAFEVGITDSVSLYQFEFDGVVYQDNFLVDIGWSELDSSSYAEIHGMFNVYSATEYDFEFFDGSALHLPLGDWEIAQGAYVYIDSTAITAENVEIAQGQQAIDLDGKISVDPNDKMNLEFRNFELGNLNPLLAGTGVTLLGTLEGTGFLSDPYDELYFEADYDVFELFINDLLAGDVELNSVYDQEKKLVRVNGGLTREEFRAIDFAGLYYPEKDEESLEMTVIFDQAELALINAFMPEETAKLYGAMDGNLDVSGTPSRPALSGELNFLRARTHIDYTNCDYRFSGKIKVYEDMIAVDMPLKDINGHDAYMSGSMLHNNFEDINLDMAFYLTNFQCLNTTADMNDLYYGTAYASGDVFATGDLDNLQVTVTAKNERNTEINLPLGGSTEVTSQDFVTFWKDNESPIEIEEEVDLSGIEMNFKLDVTDEAKMRIIFDEKVGDVMWGRGEGNINMTITPTGDFLMSGGLEVKEGEYTFTLQNAINKTFTVLPGGSMRWSGDPYNGVLDLTARYRVRTPLYDLMSNLENAEQYKSRTEVNLLMHLSENMMTPDLRFSVELPNVDEATRGYVASILNSPEELNKQAFSLLMLKKFIPPTGGASASSGLITDVGTSGTEVLATQMGIWLNEISQSVDIGFDYKPGDKLNGNELAVALSTQILNDRLTLSGNFGVQSGSTSEESSNLLGDFAVEYRLDADGQLVLKAFNRSNQNDITDVDQALFTQGVGLFYRSEYDQIEEVYTMAEFDTLPDVYWLTPVANTFRSKSHPKRQAMQKLREKREEKRRRKQEEKCLEKQAIINRYRKLTGEGPMLDPADCKQKEPQVEDKPE